MSETKTRRHARRQLGQFFTPDAVARRLVSSLDITNTSVVLEPSSGDGAFLLALVERFLDLHQGTAQERLRKTLTENVFAVEIDTTAYAAALARLEARFGPLPEHHNLVLGDFFRSEFSTSRSGGPLIGPLFGGERKFDVIIGNPPFGGTIDPLLQDILDRRFGERDGLKIKKETYSFFIVRCVELLAHSGRLRFICSDTFLTIPTMKGLREFLLNRGSPAVKRLDEFSDETTQPMVVLDFKRSGPVDHVLVDGTPLARTTIDLTGNRSWQVAESLAPLFTGPKIGDFMVASSGMTIGCNELFVRDVRDGQVVETLAFEFFDDPITIARERERARLGVLSDRQEATIRAQENAGATRRNVRTRALGAPRTLTLPHSDYRFYNKACSDIVYAPPRSAVFWRDDGDAVLTFKHNGNWYLYGVGGAPFFGREGLSWQLIAPSLNARYLPPGYILDSGAPCAFLREGIDSDELWFILGWALTPLCTRVLKEVLNHTRNIQSKDFEKLPYPFWLGPEQKARLVRRVHEIVDSARAGRHFERSDHALVDLAAEYEAGAPVTNMSGSVCPASGISEPLLQP